MCSIARNEVVSVCSDTRANYAMIRSLKSNCATACKRLTGLAYDRNSMLRTKRALKAIKGIAECCAIRKAGICFTVRRSKGPIGPVSCFKSV